METNSITQVATGILVMSCAASVFTGAAISFMMRLPGGYHQEPFWLPASIAVGSGSTITTIAYVLAEKSGFFIWQVMALGAACGILGAWGHALLASRENNSARPRKPTRKSCADRQAHLANGDGSARHHARQRVLITPIRRPRAETFAFSNAGSAGPSASRPS